VHQTGTATNEVTIVPGSPERWRVFDATLGLDALRSLIAELSDTRIGIEVLGDVGITSHVGDVLRQAGLPARLGRPAINAV
jgi:hypothetical protein